MARRSALLVPMLLALVAAAPVHAGGTHRPAHARSTVRIQVLSNRPDLVSDGNALVRVSLPRHAAVRSLKVTVNGRNVSRALARRPDGRIEGVIGGMKLGRNIVVATLRHRGGARLTITNHPNGGPVFSGPQVHPWICQPTAVDAKCDEPPKFAYFYKSTDSSKQGLQPYDPAHPPSDVANTTTDSGKTVPFIVRQETGYEDRDRYRIETLWRPGKRWTRWTPQSQWNHRLLIVHGGSCHTSYGPTNPPWGNGGLDAPGGDDITMTALGRGFSVGSTALDNSGANCNVALQAESILMLKEHIIESYGNLRYTIGEGCSGGSLAEQWMANAYPGLYQGLIATCTFPDADSTAQQIIDYALLANYFGVPASGPDAGPVVGPVPIGTLGHETVPSRPGWTTAQEAAVAGDGTANAPVSGNWAFSAYSYFGLADPTACPSSIGKQAYSAQANPGGTRCGVLDWQINLLGPRPPSVWDAEEKKVGHGFAGIPLGNVGVQYGLGALESGAISPAQFVDLNASIGGGDVDLRMHPQRIVPDKPALANAYRTGLIDDASNLDRVPIINLAGPNDPGLAHDSFRAFAIRARLDREHGTHANQVMWQGPTPIVGDVVELNQTALDAMERWLDKVQSDHSRSSLPHKVIADKPADVHDQCSDGDGHVLHDGICGNAVVPVYGTPRTVAGEPITTDQNQCQLKPLRRSDYGVTFTDDEWATLEKVFPSGVCDYSKPGVDQQRVVPWLTYFGRHGRVVYGGRPLGPAPHSMPLGRSSAGRTRRSR